MKKKIFAGLYYVNLLLALFLIFFAIYFFAFSSRPVLVQDSYVVYDFGKFGANISQYVDQRITFYGNVTGMYLFWTASNYSGQLYEFSDPNGSTLRLAPKTNESFDINVSYIILARIISDPSMCYNNSVNCAEQYYLEALMRNR